MIIDPFFRDLLPPHDPETAERFERLILQEGIRDPLVVWKEKDILVDGHHRYALATIHNLPYKVEYKSFASRGDVARWMVTTQMSRRQLSLFGRIEVALAMKGVVTNVGDFSRFVGKLVKCSHNTVHQVDVLRRHHADDEATLHRLRSGELGIATAYNRIRRPELAARIAVIQVRPRDEKELQEVLKWVQKKGFRYSRRVLKDDDQ